jgi:DNA repair exonuclease SbcCD ATPase subunit
MKLVSLKVKNYRIHTEQLVEFDTSRTLIGGRNETGKSTLVEAAHRALFMNHRRSGQDLDSMLSRFTSDPPEVELVFEQNGTHYTLRKRFNGTRGHVELESGHHERWQGNDAEEKLAALLGYDAPVLSGKADSQWAHLWIRQGRSGEDPSSQATSERDTLLARLQAQGGAAVMQSELDARVAGRFSDASAARFNQNGTPRAGSDLKKASDALEEAKLQLDERRSQTSRLTQTAKAFESATDRQAGAEVAIPGLEKLTTETEEKLRVATVIESDLAEAERQHAEAQRNHNDLHQKDLNIRGVAADIEAKAQLIEPLRTESEQSAARRREAESKLHDAREHARQAADDLRIARNCVDWLRSLDEHHKALVELTTIRQRQEKIEGFRASLEEPKAILARLPKIKASDLESLRRLDTRRTEAAAALDAIATGIEFLEGPGVAQLADSAFAPGESRIITEAAEIEVAGHRFRIRPGGGNRLNEARESFADITRRLDAEFQSLGIADLTEAIRTLELRNAADTECQQIRTNIDALDPETNTRRLEALEGSSLELESRTRRLMEKAGAETEPEDATHALREAMVSLEIADTTEKTATALVREHETLLAKAAETADKSAVKFRDAGKEHEDAKIRHQTLVETHGDDISRRERLATLKRDEETHRHSADQLRTSLAEFQPVLLKGDLERHRRSLTMQKDNLQQARIDAETARATLQRDGSQDPHGAEREAEAALERATEAHSSERRRAEAVRRLADLFREEQQQLSDRFTGPLVDRISGYLQCLFGPQARAKMTLASGSFTGLELVRPGGPFDFSSLSGGTREQLAAAVRLAMAELLAENHSGCLPVVFDDAFTNSDPDRVLALQRMLDLAASRGLQIIVLTCTPTDYTTLGAKAILLEPPLIRPSSEMSVAREHGGSSPQSESDDFPPMLPTLVSTDDMEKLLRTLSDFGGKSGNQSLRESLGWDEGRYLATKDLLLTRGNLLPGRGKGGSVSIP